MLLNIFHTSSYITYLDENAPQGTALIFNDPYIPQVNDNDAGKNGVFSLSLVGNNGTFEISPTVAERHAQFIIKVRDNTMLDFEARKSVVFQVPTKYYKLLKVFFDINNYVDMFRYFIIHY